MTDTQDKQNVSTNTGDGLWMIKDYRQKIQYRTFRNGLTTATVRFDDQCGNGHCTFSITGTYGDHQESGCIHERIATAFPELATLIKWHLTSTDGPMHYLANTMYLAAGGRELDSARLAAVWPDATDEQLSVEPEELRKALLDRLPGLLAEFRIAVESLGFDYDFPASTRNTVKVRA